MMNIVYFFENYFLFYMNASSINLVGIFFEMILPQPLASLRTAIIWKDLLTHLKALIMNWYLLVDNITSYIYKINSNFT